MKWWGKERAHSHWCRRIMEHRDLEMANFLNAARSFALKVWTELKVLAGMSRREKNILNVLLLVWHCNLSNGFQDEDFKSSMMAIGKELQISERTVVHEDTRCKSYILRNHFLSAATQKNCLVPVKRLFKKVKMLKNMVFFGSFLSRKYSIKIKSQTGETIHCYEQIVSNVPKLIYIKFPET